jgi:hypothetical protein
VEYDYNRLTADEFDREFYSSHSLALSAELPFRIGRAQQFGIGADTSIVLAAEPEPPRRNDFEVYVGYSANLTRALTLSAVGRLALRDYVQGDRTDISEILALTATYRFNRWLSASATSSFASNQSNHSVFDYNVANFGGGLGVAFHF